jgi:hypothetical protein
MGKRRPRKKEEKEKIKEAGERKRREDGKSALLMAASHYFTPDKPFPYRSATLQTREITEK